MARGVGHLPHMVNVESKDIFRRGGQSRRIPRFLGRSFLIASLAFLRQHLLEGLCGDLGFKGPASTNELKFETRH